MDWRTEFRPTKNRKFVAHHFFWRAQVVVDLGYRGVDADNPGVQIIHRGKYKWLTEHEKRLLKRRQTIEPVIGHAKADHRMDRCWLQGATGDAMNCAAGYNIRWLLRRSPISA